jgi:hypothetical protein
MTGRTSLSQSLKQAIKRSTRQFKGNRLRDAVLVWRGYLEALREFETLSDEEHALLADLLPEGQDDPLDKGWKASGWLASFGDPEADTGGKTLHLPKVRKRSAAG